MPLRARHLLVAIVFAAGVDRVCAAPADTPAAPPPTTAPTPDVPTPASPAAAAPANANTASQTEVKSEFHGSFELNNQYSPSTEPLRATLALSYSNLFSKQDELSALYQVAPQDTKQVGVFVANYAAHPLPGAVQPSIYFLDSSTNVPTAGTVGVLGKGQIIGGRLSHALSAASGASQSLTLSMDYRHFRNTTALDSTSSSITPVSYLNVALTYAGNWSAAHHEAGVNVSANFGPHGGANATNPYADGDFRARANYAYIRADSAIVFTTLPRGLRLYLRLAGQYSARSLIIDEDYPVAGIDGVRGYLEAEVLGDRALKATVQLQSPPWSRGTKQIADGFVYFDDAVAQMIDVPAGAPRRMRPRSWGFGADLFPGRHVTGALVWARPLVSASTTQAGESRVLFLLRGSF